MNTTNEDLVQDALAIIYEKYKEVKFKKGILAWAYTVLDNVMKSEFRKEARRKKILTDNIANVLEIYGCKESVEDEDSFQELVDQIWGALNLLSNKEKEVFELKLKGYSSEVIQSRLGLSRNAYYARWSRATKRLKRRLNKSGVL